MFGRGGPRAAAADAFARKQWKRARPLLETAIQQGDAQAAYELGLLCWRGLGGAQDRDRAVFLFRRAAAEGSPPALDALAVALRSGQGVDKDVAEARRLFEEAARAEHAPAMANLAAMSPPGEARMWLTRACERGYAPAMLQLSETIEPSEPGEALAWLYVAAAFAGEEAAATRAKALARRCTASAIRAAQARGRALIKQIKARAR